MSEENNKNLSLHEMIKNSKDGLDVIDFIEKNNYDTVKLQEKDSEGNTLFFLSVHKNLPSLTEYLTCKKKVDTSEQNNTNNKGDKVIIDDCKEKVKNFSVSLTSLDLNTENPMKPENPMKNDDTLQSLTLTEQVEKPKSEQTSVVGGETSIGNTLNSIVNRILNGGKKKSYGQKMVGERTLNLSTINSEMEGGDDSSDNSLSKTVNSDELLNKLLKIISNLLDSEKIYDASGYAVENTPKNVSLIKSFLYQKAKKELPNSNSKEKFNYLISKSSSELKSMLSDLKDLKKLDSDISAHMSSKMSDTTSLSLSDIKPKKTKATKEKKTKDKKPKASKSKKSK
jgi:hypothetical protein